MLNFSTRAPEWLNQAKREKNIIENLNISLSILVETMVLEVTARVGLP